MGRASTVIICSLFVFIFAQPMYASADSEVGVQYNTDYDTVYGMKGTHFLFFNGSGIDLVDVRNNSILDSESCSSSPRISANRQYVMCSNAVYEHNGTQLHVVRLGNIDMESRPSDNATVIVSGNQQQNSECFGVSGWGSLQVVSGGSTIATIQVKYTDAHGTYASASIKEAIMMEDKPEIYVLFRKNTNQYTCAPGTQYYTAKLNYTTVSSWVINAGQITESGHGSVSGCGEASFSAIEYGAFFTHFGAPTGDGGVGVCHKTNSIATGAWIQYPSQTYTTSFTSPKCYATATDSGSVSGHFVSLIEGEDVQISKAPVRIACNSASNVTVLTSNSWFTVWNDEDGDGDNDLQDQFPLEPTQWDDMDGDGYGDNPLGNFSDDCITTPGTSSIISLGCPDSDGDYYADKDEAFPSDASQWNDTDYDGYGDNLGGTRGDYCPTEYGTSTRNNTLGCPDNDFDGWADFQDVFVNDSSQWADRDGDGYGDELIGFQGDVCPDILGSSTIDRFGCIDSDGDGWSDLGDKFPYNSSIWADLDNDGYADENDAFPTDLTQWHDADGDGHGDNPYGTLGDWFPNDPTRWQDSDRDGVADEDDAFNSDATQWNDTDGDGYGDEESGNRADAFPNDPTEWKDSDDDGVGDNADDFPFDPTQVTDSDGDGMGDNPMGIGADKFPDESTQWADIDGDGYGDNPDGVNPDAFITDPTQWNDTDGDGYGDSPIGRLPDLFPNNPTQWEDADEDGLGDNQNGTDADPYLNDFDNDGYNDSIDILPKLASQGDLDNDGCMDDVDVFPTDYKECSDFDGDGEGDNADIDDDNDGWSDNDEIRLGTDPFGASDTPVESFEIVVPGTAIGLGAWDLIGIFGGVPIFSWLAFGFATRNARCARYEDMLNSATSRIELENVAYKWEYSLMLRLLGPHQGIRLERLRAELDAGFEEAETDTTQMGVDQTQYVETQEAAKEIPQLETVQSPPAQMAGTPAADGYEWLDADGTKWYRVTGSGSEWTRWES